ncbi:hypothetical protein JTB14_027507 [Gonioctena quinquepunctata]|nr:hypothetical protein JTB14_027507 [Gonioctena quinquepunctata]
MCFTDLKAPLRTDEQFSTGEYEEYMKGPSPLSELGIGMLSKIPNDYMHSVCLGVMRKLLFLWRSGSRLYRFKIEKYCLLEERLVDLKSYWPVEFNRKPRTLKDLEHWKATEFRQFLLYISPLLIDILPNKQVFCNLMLLKFGLTILLSPNLNSDGYLNNYAKELLHNFVKNAIDIYGKDFCVYNVHSVIHFADYGTLNDINCFAFENYLSFLKRSLRKSNNSLQQAVNRIKEGRNMSRGLENINNTCTIEFPNEQNETGAVSMAIISSSWIFEDDGGSFCYWPSYFRTDLLKDRAVQNHMTLHEDKCMKSPILVKFSTDEYLKARSKLQRLEIESQTESEMEDVESRRKPKKNFLMTMRVMIVKLIFHKFHYQKKFCGNTSQRSITTKSAQNQKYAPNISISQKNLERTIELDEISTASSSEKLSTASCTGCDERRKNC